MIHTVLTLLVICIVIGFVVYLLGILPLPAPWRVIVQALAVVAAILVLIDMLVGGGVTGITLLRRAC